MKTLGLLSTTVYMSFTLALAGTSNVSAQQSVLRVFSWGRVTADLSATLQSIGSGTGVQLQIEGDSLNDITFQAMSNTRSTLVLAPLNRLLSLIAKNGKSVDILSTVSPIYIHVIGRSSGPNSVEQGYQQAAVATLYGTSQSDAVALLEGIGNAYADCHSQTGCTLFDEDKTGLGDSLRDFFRKGDRPSLVIISAEELAKDAKRSRVVYDVLGMGGVKLLDIPAQIIRRMKGDYASATIPANTYMNRSGIETAASPRILAGRAAWRAESQRALVNYLDELNALIFDPKRQRFDLETDGRIMARQLLTIEGRTKGAVRVDPSLRGYLQKLR